LIYFVAPNADTDFFGVLTGNFKYKFTFAPGITVAARPVYFGHDLQDIASEFHYLSFNGTKIRFAAPTSCSVEKIA
jgi:hypothetical protein